MHGVRLYGRVDVVPGVFHVATEFFHIGLAPFVPLRTWLVLKEEGVVLPRFHGKRIPWSWKSVLVGWLRGWAGVWAVFSAIGLGVVIHLREEGAVLAAVEALVFGALAWVTPRMFRANFARAKELVARGGDPALDAEVERFYDPRRRP
jgi:hypothetical protein